MTAADVRPDDLETLSALLDGELDAQASRFAMRRLGHDAEWQGRLGRWQMAGDVLRRQAPIAAPAGFAERVSGALAAERIAVPAPSASTSQRRATRGRWIGGALAASVALVAAVSLMPGGQDAAPSGPVVASAPARVPVEMPAVADAAPRVASASPVQVPAPSTTPVLSARSQAVASAPARRAPRPVASVAVANRSVVPAANEAALRLGESGNPFNLASSDALTVQAWPQASVGNGAFTARYGQQSDSDGERPSFYPFEPRRPTTRRRPRLDRTARRPQLEHSP